MLTDLSAGTLAHLRKSRIEGIPWVEGQVHPAYGGTSILNLPASLASWLGADPLPHLPLDLPGLDALGRDVRQVVTLLVDALSFDRFVSWAEAEFAYWDRYASDGLFAMLTSVVPSTTSSALTTLWTGHSPAEHGMLGFELFLREYGMLINMITHTPVGLEHDPGLLYQAGFTPENALPVDTLGPRWTQAGVELHAILPAHIRKSGLTRIHYQGVPVQGYRNQNEFWLAMRSCMEDATHQPRLIWGYYPDVDTLSHRHGPDSRQAKADFRRFLAGMRSEFLEKLSSHARTNTLLILLADHGQINTRHDPHYEVRNHPTLVKRLHLLPCGENRLLYLYPRPGQTEAVREYFDKIWPHTFDLMKSSYALARGLFGPGPPAENALARLGDIIAVARRDAYLWSAAGENKLHGRHGGLAEEEMLVPFLALRLG